MVRDVSFRLGISLGEVSDIKHSARGAPSLEDAFTWFVSYTNDVVTVHAQYEGAVREIGGARWSDGKLVDISSAAKDFPNDYQLNMVGTALAGVLGGKFTGTRGVANVRVARRSRRVPMIIAIAIFGFFATIGTIATVSSRKSSRKAPPPAIAAPQPAPAVPPSPTMPARAELGDGAEHDGVWKLARYASTKLVWADVDGADETTVPLVLKDSDRERGKRLCTSGQIVDIERRDVDQRPVHVGALRTSDGDDVRFVATGSTGLLVKRSDAKLCGIATGRDGKAAVIVGMFDLPENRAPMVER